MKTAIKFFSKPVKLLTLLLLITISLGFDGSKKVFRDKVDEYLDILRKIDSTNGYYNIALYNLGTSYACLDMKDSALYFALQSVIYCSNPSDLAQMDNDFFFRKYHGTKNWSDIRKLIKKKFYELTDFNIDKDLAFSLLRLKGIDQTIRYYRYFLPKDTSSRSEIRKQLEYVSQEAKKIYKNNGVPTISKVGEDANHAFFLLIQHSDADTALQSKVLSEYEKLIKTSEVVAVDYAYLKDRLMVARTGKQYYGTQFINVKEKKLYPIIDSASVDRRRQAIGLNTLEEYKTGFITF